MSEQLEGQAPVKAKRQRKVQPEEMRAIVAPPEVMIGSWASNAPEDSVNRGVAIANALAPIINKQNLFSIIKNKRGERLKYVRCEGWTTMGAMLGVFPVEDYCRPLPNAKGYEAKINLIRSRDGMVIGAASAECTHDESNWKDRDSYSLRSMALTRATSKAFRLSFSWIIKLAGFEPTPAEEMLGQEDASVIREQVESEVERQKAQPTHQEPITATNGAAKSLFISHPPAFENKFAFVTGLEAVKAYGLKAYIEREAKGIWMDTDSGWRVPIEHIAELTEVVQASGCPIHVQRPK